MAKKLLPYLWLALALSALMVLIVWRQMFMGLQAGIENRFYDFDRPDPNLVIVAIDEISMKPERLGPFRGWKREFYAKTIENLYQAGASVAALDVTLPDASPFGTEDDAALKKVLESHPQTVLAARYYFENGQRRIEMPNTAVAPAQAHVGWINVLPGADGIVRWLPLFAGTQTSTAEAMSLAVAREIQKTAPVEYRVKNGSYRFSETLNIPATLKKDARTGAEVPLMRLNYFAEPNTYPRVSFADAAEGKLPDLKGKITLIGPTAIDLQDNYPSPVRAGVRMPGVEVHAAALQTVLSGRFLKEPAPATLNLLLAALLLANILLAARLKLRYSLPLVLLQLIAWPVAGIAGYESGRMLNVVYPMVATLLAFAGTYLVRFVREQKEKQFLEGAFSHYVNKDVVKQIIKNPKMLELGGAKREIAIFFSDIADSTGLAEKMEPAALVAFLNEYLSAMTDVILKHGGTLDKYEGDAVMAFWGAPLSIQDPSLQACLAALECQSTLAELNARWQTEKRPAIAIRTGLNTGPAIVGNVGSKSRFNYTAMGDAVNLASRLEGVNKVYGTRILVSESVKNAAQNEVEFREIDRVVVKGKTEAVTLFEPLGKKGGIPMPLQTLKHDYETALGDMRARNFIAAEKAFAALAETDAPAKVMLTRCREFLKTPPPQGWNGVIALTEK